jgi:hypothetical protein
MEEKKTMTEEEAYLKTLLYISLRDDSLSPDELTYFHSLGKSLGFTAAEMEAMVSSIRAHEEPIEQITAGIRSVKMKLWLVSELVSLCYADGDYSLAEKNGMREICRLISLDEPSLKEVEESFSSSAPEDSAEKLLNNLRSFFSDEFTSSISLLRSQLSSALAHAAANGLNTIASDVPYSMADAFTLMEQNSQIRNILETEDVSSAVREKLDIQLRTKVSALRRQLATESDPETVLSIEAQIDDLLRTIAAVNRN